jgi:hypothetical protein
MIAPVVGVPAILPASFILSCDEHLCRKRHLFGFTKASLLRLGIAIRGIYRPGYEANETSVDLNSYVDIGVDTYI